MTEEELTARVVSIIATQQKLPPGRVNAESSFQELGIDSLDGVTLLFAFEEEFDITIPEHVAQQMKDVRQAVAGLRQVLQKRAAAAAAQAQAARDGAAAAEAAPAGDAPGEATPGGSPRRPQKREASN